MNNLNNINDVTGVTEELSNFNHKFSKKNGYPDWRIPSGCAIFGIVNENGKTFDGSIVVEAISLMHERSNGLGGGFAAYGIYPEFANDWAFHIYFDDVISKQQTEDIIKMDYKIIHAEEIPTRKNAANISNPPIMYRYFLNAKDIFEEKQQEEDFIVNFVMKINNQVPGAYIISSGKNMGIFKGVGYPEDIGEFFKVADYKAYLWTSHGRFPTNSVGWWGGAHPFGLLNWSVVHNGEISSYGRNLRFVAGFGYKCSLSTDTEVITYLFDLLMRNKDIDLNMINLILASPLWEQIDRMPQEEKEIVKTLRIMYSGALINGPFSIIVGHNDFMYALNDRIKLRPMVAARKDDFLFISSEEAAIRKVCPSPDILWHPEGGIPVIGMVNHKAVNHNTKIKSKVL
jgi:glutamate synthase domain-containing protein 1